MSERLDDKTSSTLLRYLRNVRSSPHERAKTSRFATLIGELFCGTPAPTDFAAGVQTVIRIDTPLGPKRGRMDASYGNVIIEFERSLRPRGTRERSAAGVTDRASGPRRGKPADP
ncbi:MAG: hypothetical protein O6929_07975 [candidate division NC10 bacterium]|nr:hypothetical protein [candidate division NC10 bacterium]MCZ6752517.1 hypothetical protein [Acidobacteriota bacterium]